MTNSIVLSISLLANSIRVAEGNNPHFLYGIHHAHMSIPLSETEARKRCVQTINHALRDYTTSEASIKPSAPPTHPTTHPTKTKTTANISPRPFIHYLSVRYCPCGSNQWAENVIRIYENQRR